MTKSQNLGWQFYHDRAIISCDAIVAPNLSARVPAFRKQQGRGARLQAAVFPLPQRNRIFEWRITKMNFIKCEKLEKSMAELQFSIDAEAFKAAVADVFKNEGKK